MSYVTLIEDTKKLHFAPPQISSVGNRMLGSQVLKEDPCGGTGWGVGGGGEVRAEDAWGAQRASLTEQDHRPQPQAVPAARKLQS